MLKVHFSLFSTTISASLYTRSVIQLPNLPIAVHVTYKVCVVGVFTLSTVLISDISTDIYGVFIAQVLESAPRSSSSFLIKGFSN